MRFKIDAVSPTSRAQRIFTYDTNTSEILEDGLPINVAHVAHFLDMPSGSSTNAGHLISDKHPGRKVKAARVLKIQLGLSCNYSCEYCSQRFVPKSLETGPSDVDSFVDQLQGWFDGGSDGVGSEVVIQYWGGEPFVYWKTLKPLAERLRALYPNASHAIITNGSLLDASKNEWLDRMGFSVALSHDGPGQHLRGPDPLNNPESKNAILDLFNRLHPVGRFSFASMLTGRYSSRHEIHKFFSNLTGRTDVVISEGGLVDPYDDGGILNSLAEDNAIKHRIDAYNELRSGKVSPANFEIANTKVVRFIQSILLNKPIDAIRQKCGMDRPEHIAIDLRGNVLTCQNVSSASIAPNGNSHKIGHVSDFDSISLNTARSWATRSNCKDCVVVHLCGGSCMFLEGSLWDRACLNSYNDNIPFFAMAFEILTGFVPIAINDVSLWEERQQGRRVIPISVSHD